MTYYNKKNNLNFVVSLDYLRTFVIFVESKNIYEASEKLNLSQPALSIQLKALEKELGQSLFQLKGKKKVLNGFGQELYKSVGPKIHELQLRIQRARELFHTPANLTVRIAGRREALKAVMDKINYNGNLQLLTLPTSKALNLLNNGNVDFVVDDVLPDSLTLKTKKLQSHKSHFLIHKRLFNQGRKPNLGAFRDEGFLSQTPLVSYHQNHDLMKLWCDHYSINIENLLLGPQIDDWDSVLTAIEKGMGYGIVPDYIVSKSKSVLSFAIPKTVIKETNYYVVAKQATLDIFNLDQIF